MANVLVLGGGFAGVVAAESLAKQLAPEHQITLVARESRFVFYPALVRLAFGKCEPDDISYDLRKAMLSRRIRFIQAEVARVDPYERKALLAHGEVEGELSYDYLVFALGRRLATERVTGFYEHAHHLLTVEATLRFGQSLQDFHEGRAIIGYCKDARLAVPVYEAAFALSGLLKEQGNRENVRIILISPEPPSDQLGGAEMAQALHKALKAHDIEFLPNFPIKNITANRVETEDGSALSYDLLMLLPPFHGASAVIGMGITDEEGFIRVDQMLRVQGVERMYAAGDCTNFPGPKMGHMAVRQGEVAARNLAAEIKGREPDAKYHHEMMLVIDEGGRDSIFLRKSLSEEDEGVVRQGHFWSWAKRVQQKYWEGRHF